MKRILCLLLCLCLVLSLAGCKRQPVTNPTDHTTQPSQQQSSTESTGAQDPTDTTGTEPSEPTLQVPSLPMISASFPMHQELFNADDGTVLFRYTFQDVSLNITDPDISKSITLDLLQRMDAYIENVSELLDQAYEDYVPGKAWSAYYYEALYTPTRIDEMLLSLQGVHSSFDGNVHPSHTMTSATYDLVTGKFLSVKDILSEEAGAAEALGKAVVAQLDKIVTEQNLFPGYDLIVKDQFAVDLNRHYSWYFTLEGICFYFSPFELAPNSSGVIQVTVPYSQLAGILQDAYFPTEQPPMAAKGTTGWFDETDLSQFSHFTELISAPDARRFLLWTDTIIYNVRLEQGHWDTAANQFVPEVAVFSANCIAQGDAVTLRCNLSDTTPTLRLVYTADGVEQMCYLTRNYTTGAINLTPAK